ncbi:hypothetical protein M758_3G204700 [Ceratodon purpureus]|nr:hypothetical protein M758_3G204700 [Ceratodon purpureus]
MCIFLLKFMMFIMSPKWTALSFYSFLPLFFLSAPLSSAKSETYQFTFPQFSYPSSDTTIGVYGDIQFSKDNRSWILNTNSAATATGSCAQLTYTGEPNLHIQEKTSGKMASFSTSFTFRFTTPPQQQAWEDANSSDTSRVETGISFMLSKSSREESSMYDRNYWTSQPGACIWAPSENYNTIVFRSVYNAKRNIPSNNYIGVIDGTSLNRVFKPGSTYNLCGNETHCAYYSGGGTFTAWIDFTPERSLQVRLRNGSYAHMDKPLMPLIDMVNYTLPSGEGDYLSFTFLGSSGESQVYEAHEILSWSFTSDGLEVASQRGWVGPVWGVSGVVAILLLVGYFLFRLAKRRRFAAVSLCPLQPRGFSYKELRIATKNFCESQKLGSGGYGTVYKGTFRSSDGMDTILAVKRINYELKHAEKTFLAEISSLSHIKHGNIVQLQGWCHEKSRLLLLYDYMPNGSLNEWLHDASDVNGKQRTPLSWKVRHRILVEVATALEYLHKDCIQCVLHRDIKSSNIMLDADFKAHLGDFGLARLMDHNKLDKTTMAAGTIGYMAPEVSYTGKATKESDVYSFGILVLEVVCGTSPLDLNAHELDVRTLDLEDDVLLHKVWRAHETGKYLTVADPRLLRTCCRHCPLQFGNHQNAEKLAIRVDVSAHSGPSSYNFRNINVDDNVVSPIEAIGVIESEASEEMMVKNLLQLGLLCCLPSPQARPTMGQVVGILQQIGNIGNVDYVVTKVSMPPLPSTNPVEMYTFRKFLRIEGSVSQD